MVGIGITEIILNIKKQQRGWKGLGYSIWRGGKTLGVIIKVVVYKDKL